MPSASSSKMLAMTVSLIVSALFLAAAILPGSPGGLVA